MADDRHSWAKMSGDFLREASVLVLVFGMLDKYVHENGPSAGWAGIVIGVSLLGFAIGGIMERVRRS